MNLRIEMPQTAAWIDELRTVFGKDQIVPSIRAGMEGGSAFYACENGYELGRKDNRVGIHQLQCTDTRREIGNAKNARRGK